jgi:Carboxypeptidase regulatory-like domain
LRLILPITTTLLLGLSPSFTASAQTRLPAPNSAPNSAKIVACTVSGTVVALAGSLPLGSVTVRLENVDDHSRAFSAQTDANGRFELTGIDPGRYRLRVIQLGFVTMEYGQRTPSDPGAVLTLNSGQLMKDLLFRLIPSAVISGHVQDQDGNPLPWVRVSALRQTYLRGSPRLTSEVTVVTNDLGEYRLFGLRPGRYFIHASYKPGQRLDANLDATDDTGQAQDAAKSGFVPTYYPGTNDPSKALAVTVKAGDEISSTDFLLEPATLYSVRGHATIFGLHRPAEGATLTLEPRVSTWSWSSQIRQSLVDSDGAFEIPEVLPGSYNLVATWMNEGRRYQTRQPVDISTADADSLQLSLTTGWTVSGQIVWDPQPSTERGTMAVTVRSVNTSVIVSQTARVASNGTFTLKDLPEGAYELTTFGQTPDCYLKTIRFSGMEVSDDEFNVIRGTQATLEVTISSRGARVQGTVTDQDGLPAVAVWVVLVPDASHRNQSHLYKLITTDQYGRFDLRGIAPGDYTLFSWEHVDRNAWQDPDFLKEFESQGLSVPLQEGDLRSATIVAIRSPAQEQDKP